MKQPEHILDPLWITKGSQGIDTEYFKYIMLAANKKWREKLEAGDFTSFYEILFHTLNLNNLVIDGSVLDFNMNPTWKNDNIMQIRNTIKNIYDADGEAIDIFRNSNRILIGVLLDYLDYLLDVYDDCNIYYTNHFIHNQDEIFIILNLEESKKYNVWRLKFDKKFKYNHRISKCRDIAISDLRENILVDTIKSMNNKTLNRMDPKSNVIFSISKDEYVQSDNAHAIAFTLIFSRLIMKDVRFEPDVMYQLYDILIKEKTLPFTIKNLI